MSGRRRGRMAAFRVARSRRRAQRRGWSGDGEVQDDGNGVHGALAGRGEHLRTSFGTLPRERERTASTHGVLRRRSANIGRILNIIRQGNGEHARDEDDASARLLWREAVCLGSGRL
jgi:hypothetical protein